MKATFNVFSVISLILVIIGAINWLVIGIFGFDFVNWVSFGVSWLPRVIYSLVGIAGIFMIVWLCMARFTMVNTSHYNERNYQ